METKLDDDTIILVTDDDNIKMNNWSTILIDNIKNNPSAISTIDNHKEIHGGRGFGLYNNTINFDDLLKVFNEVKDVCKLADDDIFTYYSYYRKIPINYITGVYPLYPETDYFTHKLRDLTNDNNRELLKKKCYDKFKELNYI